MIQWIIYIAIIVTAFAFLFRQMGSMIKSAAAINPNDLMSNTSARAVAVAASRGVTLDYSFESIKSVEVSLGTLHELRSSGKLTDREVQNEALNFGAYIGETLRKNFGGSWARDSAVAGAGTYPLTCAGGETYPVGWCGKRILNGAEDNVWTKFQVVVSRLPPAAEDANSLTGEQPILKIAVYADGQFTADDAPCELEQLVGMLSRLSKQKGIVWYYRESGGEPPPIAMRIMQEVAKARLPIRLSSKPDYSDSIGPGGPTPVPRK